MSNFHGRTIDRYVDAEVAKKAWIVLDNAVWWTGDVGIDTAVIMKSVLLVSRDIEDGICRGSVSRSILKDCERVGLYVESANAG